MSHNGGFVPTAGQIIAKLYITCVISIAMLTYADCNELGVSEI
jgi:hypothetical protein